YPRGDSLTHTAAVGEEVALGDACASGRFTVTGECCDLCPPGFGVAVECGRENTKCQPCQDGVSFSVSGSAPCQPCSRCPDGIPKIGGCSAARDTQCDCGDGFYLLGQGNHSTGLCAPCRVCRKGQGVVQACGPLGDTRCQACGSGSFSEEHSSTEPCRPCRVCLDSEVEIQACLPHSDTLCMDKNLQILTRPDSDSAQESPRRQAPEGEGDEEGSSPPPGSPKFTPQEEGGNNIIPVYVSILSAVVLGLLLYVAYKCWSSCKQKRALAKARGGELSGVPEGEKLHSDSGVFLDTHSLQDNHPGKGGLRDSKQDSRLYLNLSPQRQEEVETLLQEAGGKGWRHLAAQLEYEQDRIDTFGRGEDPVHTLLSDWAGQEGSTVAALCSALERIDRSDVAGALSRPAQASSVV
uniref:Neurotrophin receptor associated death domain n=1 Tax=Lepisosteus oculatus TaxID=7918 RepID=W5MEJ0_LEPOC